MIRKNVVYHKSAKGAEAIANRQHGLSPKLRSLLIMVDGKKGFEELVRLSQMLGDTEELLGQLLDQQFIEPAAQTPAAASAPAASGPAAASPAAMPGSAARAPVTLKEAQRYASHRLTTLLGPNAEDLCLKIEAAKTVQEYQAAVARAEGLVRQYKSAQTVADFAADVQAHMPAG